MNKGLRTVINSAVLVGALGYFVDIYDIVLFSIVRVSSLKSIGVAPGEMVNIGVFLINMQMIGMLLGGLIWGVLGDKRGRISVLFGSIFLYSIANIGNAFVTSVPAYGAFRFLAGMGLAGELGAAITLVSEVMTKETRGYGTSIVAAVGICGAVAAALIGDSFSWQTAYIVGGCLGLTLLMTRIRLIESGLFSELKGPALKKGDLRMLVNSWERFSRYLRCILIGLPIWFVIGIIITFSPEIAKELGVTGPVAAGKAIMYCYIGLAFGDIASGLLSQFLGSRKKIVAGFLALTATFITGTLLCRGLSPEAFYALCALLGVSTGYWAMFVTIASEQFGTNLRATVTTTVPNFVRGSVVPLALVFRALSPTTGLVNAALMIGAGCLIVASLALIGMSETFGKDLNFIELSDS